MKLTYIMNKLLFSLQGVTTRKGFNQMLTICVFFTALAIYTVYQYSATNKEAPTELAFEAENIERHINSIYILTTQITNYVGKIIANGNYTDKHWVHQQLKNFDNYHTKMQEGMNIPWPLLSWVNKEKFLVVNQHFGILEEPKYVNRIYTKFGRLKPWEVLISQPAPSVLDNSFIFTAGSGITNKNNDFIGYIGLGWNAEDFISSIVKNVLYNKNIKFIICGPDGTVYLASEPDLLKKFRNIKDYGFTNVHSQGLIEKISIEDNLYFYRKPISTISGLSLFVGYDKYTLIKKVILNILVKVLGGLAVIGICVILILYTTSMLMHTILMVEKAKRKSIDEIKDAISDAITSSVKQFEEIEYLTKNLPPGAKENLHNVIHDVTESIKMLGINSCNNCNQVEIDLNKIILEAIEILHNDLLLQNVEIKTNLGKNLPQILADPLQVKQIIVNMVAFIMQSRTKSTRIPIVTYSKALGNVLDIFVVFENIDFTDPNSVNKGLNLHLQDKKIKLEDILELVLHNKGQLNIKHHNNNRSTIQIKFVKDMNAAEACSNITFLSDYKNRNKQNA